MNDIERNHGRKPHRIRFLLAMFAISGLIQGAGDLNQMLGIWTSGPLGEGRPPDGFATRELRGVVRARYTEPSSPGSCEGGA